MEIFLRMILWFSVFVVFFGGPREIFGMQEISNSTSRNFDVCPGFKLFIHDDELRVKINLKQIFEVTAVQSRTNHEEDKKPGPLQRFGSFMIMIPLIFQMLSVPGAIASIKMSLLKSLVVGKIALIIMLFNLVRNQPKNEVVVVHQSLPQSHSHYYPHYHEDEDEDKGWFG